MNIALVLSGGVGTRLGADMPKQYIPVNGKMIIEYCLETLLGHGKIDAIQIVLDAAWETDVKERCQSLPEGKAKKISFSSPGRNRQESIWHGLCDIRDYAEEDSLVLVHDAARPLLSKKMITECFQAVQGHDGVMPVLPMKDTVYTSKEGRKVSGLLDRSTVFAGQAPELFHLGKYYRACEALLPDDRMMQINGSTEPAIMAGMDVVMISGDEGNYKITTREDLERFQEKVLMGGKA